VDPKQKLEECKRILGEGGGIQHYAAEAPSRPRVGGTMSPGDLQTWRTHLVGRMNKEVADAVDRIHAGSEGAYMNDPQAAWKKTGKKVHDALKKIEDLLDEVVKVSKTVS
jgi:hypothetical protein